MEFRSMHAFHIQFTPEAYLDKIEESLMEDSSLCGKVVADLTLKRAFGFCDHSKNTLLCECAFDLDDLKDVRAEARRRMGEG